MAYPVTSASYLDRMKVLLDAGTEEALIYAALELRCGVEARLKQYIETIKHIPKNQKKEWEVAKLGRSIENAYRTGDKIMIFTIQFPEDGAELQLMYTPVTKRLQEIAKKLGNYLHAPTESAVARDDWWKDLRGLLSEGYPLLKLANAGELVGLPLLHRPTNRLEVRAILEGERARIDLLQRFKGGDKHQLRVDYIDPIPGTMTFYES